MLLLNMGYFKILLFCFLISALTALQQDVQGRVGDDVTLQCQISTEEIISVLKWSRADLNTDGYVYFYRNKRSYENYQHPSFHGRVKLRDPEMKDGDVSLILMNVTFNDTGMYECHIAVRKSGRSKRVHTEISHFINLTVTAERHESVSEKQVMEKGDGNMHDAERILTDQEITAVSGQNVPLTCRVPNNNGETVEWSRADLRDKYVLVLKNKKPKEDDQDPSFENRVALQDKEMKDGNVSLILYNVTAADNGTYECRVLMEETQSLDLICSITLSVVDPPGE
uniref:muscle M-line assembly protein unc-89-like n=1 Tax=Maylandia zebra TaxID=106582 RepID=UPI000D320D5A|nr:muscle M-line assembly protein unc-89-like [Maylandia zebra]